MTTISCPPASVGPLVLPLALFSVPRIWRLFERLESGVSSLSAIMANVDTQVFVRAYVAADTVSPVALRVDTTTSAESYECIVVRDQ